MGLPVIFFISGLLIICVYLVSFIISDSILCSMCRYEVRFQNGQECGGAYIKLLSHQDNLDLVRIFLVQIVMELT